MAAIFRRFNRSVRSAANGGGVTAVMTRHRRSCRWVGVQRPGGTVGRVSTSACPAGLGTGAWPLVARMDRTSAARHRLNATARSNAARSGSVPCAACRVRMSPISPGSLVTPAAAAPVGTAVVVIDDGPLTWRNQRMVGVNLSGDRFDDPQGPVIDQHCDGRADQLVRDPSGGLSRTGCRTACRPCGSSATPRTQVAATAEERAAPARRATVTAGTAQTFEPLLR